VSLEAKEKGGMSNTRRTILRVIELVKKVMIWRVGDGQNLNIWSDLGLPKEWTRRPITPLPREWTRRPITPPRNNLLTAADDLIDPATGDWDREGGRRQADLGLAVNEGRQNWLAWNFGPGLVTKFCTP
jgi:hypothetical protein